MNRRQFLGLPLVLSQRPTRKKEKEKEEEEDAELIFADKSLFASLNLDRIEVNYSTVPIEITFTPTKGEKQTRTFTVKDIWDAIGYIRTQVDYLNLQKDIDGAFYIDMKKFLEGNSNDK